MTEVREISLHDRITLTIADEGYQLIAELVKAYQICADCHRPYTEKNPLVALNCCLSCFKKLSWQNAELRFIGQKPGSEQWLFLDPDNYVKVSTASHRQIDRYEDDTLAYWGYPCPATVQDGEQTIDLKPWRWTIWGKLPDPVIVITCQNKYINPHKEYAFLTTRKGSYQQLDKRQKATRDMLTQARAAAHTTNMSDHRLYRVLSELKSKEYAAAHLQQESAPTREEERL
jgi:hypothetical protein